MGNLLRRCDVHLPYIREVVKGFKIKGCKNSAAQKYAKSNKINFVFIKNKEKQNEKSAFYTSVC